MMDTVRYVLFSSFFFLYITLTKQYTNAIYKQLGYRNPNPILTLCEKLYPALMTYINFHYMVQRCIVENFPPDSRVT